MNCPYCGNEMHEEGSFVNSEPALAYIETEFTCESCKVEFYGIVNLQGYPPGHPEREVEEKKPGLFSRMRN